jgi:hypothetical protein
MCSGTEHLTASTAAAQCVQAVDSVACFQHPTQGTLDDPTAQQQVQLLREQVL